MKLRVSVLALLCTLGWPGAGAFGAGADVRLGPEARVASARFTLGEVAAVSASDASLRRRLEALVLGTVPRSGYATAFSRSALAARVERIDPGLARQVRWSGAGSVEVRLAGEVVSGDWLAAVAAEALERAWAERFPGLDAEPAGPVAGVHIPAGPLEVVPRVPMAAGVAKRSCVWLDLNVGGRFYRSVPVWFKVRAPQSAWVATRDLQRGETPRAEDFVRRPVDAASYAAPLSPSRAGELDRVRMARRVAAGEPLLAPDTRPKAAVSRHERVTVRSVAGGVVIETAGVALGDGRVGDTVEVRNSETREKFAATVVADGAVLVGPGGTP